MTKTIPCPMCKGVAVFCTRSDHVYRRDFGPIYDCRKCDAFVGCHKGTDEPLGTPANQAGRDARKLAHAAFDPTWNWARGGWMYRTEAYRNLAAEMGLTKDQCHIGMFDIEQCRRVVEICAAWRAARGQA